MPWGTKGREGIQTETMSVWLCKQVEATVSDISELELPDGQAQLVTAECNLLEIAVVTEQIFFFARSSHSSTPTLLESKIHFFNHY